MNRRGSESLVSKHNEALKVLPVLFNQNGYRVTVCNPPYANYQWIPDLSIYDDYPEINAYIPDDDFSNTTNSASSVENNYRNFFCFSVMKTMPLAFQSTIYDSGRYNQSIFFSEEDAYWTQTIENPSQAYGLNPLFMKPYSILLSLPYMTHITEADTGTFLFLANDAAHESMLLQLPDYTPSVTVDNREYDAANSDRFTLNGRTLAVDNELQMRHYHGNMAVILQLGNWFDYLREKGVYDNTRIIMVSDHGYNLEQLSELMLDNGATKEKDVESFFPLLMVKDFNSEGFMVSDEFMTNADVPTLATAGLIENPINPFTGKPINSDEKTAHDQFIITASDWDLQENNGNTFLPGTWARVKNNLWDKNNWTFYDEATVLTEHAAP